MPAIEHKPEILAPAGGMPQLEAAVHAGADAVYFGLDRGFNARVRSAGFSTDELAEAMDFLHSHGRRGYLTLNILLFDEELEEVEQLVRHAATTGVDALIVQDIGVIRLARTVAPNLPLHGSTQMSITDANGVRFAQSLGIERVVVGRELSIDEIARIEADTPMEIEAFVHGALCVSYSGQCFSSEAWGGRSANRGQCAQACRLPYGLLVDGQIRQQGDFNYLLSPQDLMALQKLPRLINAGVSCFKIEGRLKGPEYVLRTVRAYREALDTAWAEHQAGLPPQDLPLAQETRRRLAQVFSRGQSSQADGLTPGFLEGPRHQELVIGRNPRHRGLYLGCVSGITQHGAKLNLQNPVKAGDGIVFDSGNPQSKEPGGNIYHILKSGKPVRGEIRQGRVELTFSPAFHPDDVHEGDLVWRTKDASMDAGPRLQRQEAAGKVGLTVEVAAKINEPLCITMSTDDGATALARSAHKCEAAERSSLDARDIRKAIGSLGDTPFQIEQLDFLLDKGLFLPLSDIKQARRKACETLHTKLLRHDRDAGLGSEPVLPVLLPKTEPPHRVETPHLSILCRTLEQVGAALQLDGLHEIIVDFLEVHGLKQACDHVKRANRRLVVAAPRIFKPGEGRLVRYLLNLNADALLVRSSGLLQELAELGGTGGSYDDEIPIPELLGDFSLNASNVLSAQMLLDMGLSRLALTHDVNARQLQNLARALAPEQRGRIEVIAHQHLPIFHTEHCVFARFMSQGNSFRDCGRPCERHQVHLRDPAGADHLIQADIGCRNTVFNAQAQSAAPFIQELLDAGLKHFRIELVDEPAKQVAPIVEGYRKLLQGGLSHENLWSTLQRVPDANNRPQGVGLGSLSVSIEAPKSSMKKPTSR